MPKKRCSCYTKNSNFKIKCKNPISCELNHKFYCYTHAQIIYEKCATYIQKIYRSFYKRKKIKNIFTNLPYDIRNKILFYVRENYLIKKHHHNVISNILNKNLEFMKHNKIFTNFALSLYNTNISLEQREKYIIDIVNIYKLYTKYQMIANPIQKYFLYDKKWWIYNKIENLFESGMYNKNLLEELNAVVINYPIVPYINAVNN